MRTKLAFFLTVLLLLASCQSAAPQQEAESPLPRGRITIGSKSITEQYLLMKMSALMMRERGIQVKEMVFLDSPAIRSAMEAGVLDLYWEYTTTARIFYHKETPLYDPGEAYREVARTDLEKGIVWLPKSTFNSSWALLMRKDISEQLHIYSISDLASYVQNQNPRMKFATNDEYLKREDGLERLKQIYEFTLSPDQVVAIESDLLPQAVKDGRVEVVVGMASDPRIKKNQLVILQDDRNVFPPYEAAPVVLGSTLDRYPDIREAMEQLTAHITDETMLELMYQVDILQKDITKTARDFLIAHGLLSP